MNRHVSVCSAATAIIGLLLWPVAGLPKSLAPDQAPHAQRNGSPPPAPHDGPPLITPHNTPGPSMAVALAMAQRALAACQAKGWAVSVSVVDAAGGARATLVADGSNGISATAVRKGATAVAFQTPGSELEEKAKSDPVLAAKLAKPEYNAHSGSVLVRIDGRIVGAIGVSGAPTHEGDEACARAGLEALPAGAGR